MFILHIASNYDAVGVYWYVVDTATEYITVSSKFMDSRLVSGGRDFDICQISSKLLWLLVCL